MEKLATSVALERISRCDLGPVWFPALNLVAVDCPKRKLKGQLNVEVFPTSLPQPNGEGNLLMQHLKRWLVHWSWFCDCWLALGGCYTVSAILCQNASPDCGDGCLMLVPAVDVSGLDFSSVRKHNPIGEPPRPEGREVRPRSHAFSRNDTDMEIVGDQGKS